MAAPPQESQPGLSVRVPSSTGNWAQSCHGGCGLRGGCKCGETRRQCDIAWALVGVTNDSAGGARLARGVAAIVWGGYTAVSGVRGQRLKDFRGLSRRPVWSVSQVEIPGSRNLSPLAFPWADADPMRIVEMCERRVTSPDGGALAAVYRFAHRVAVSRRFIRAGQGSGTGYISLRRIRARVLRRADRELNCTCASNPPHAQVSAPPLGVPSEWVRWLNRVRQLARCRNEGSGVFTRCSTKAPKGRNTRWPQPLRYKRPVEEFLQQQRVASLSRPHLSPAIWWWLTPNSPWPASSCLTGWF